MVKVSDFNDNTRNNNIIIQQALREIDSEMLSIAMLGYGSDERETVLRNMSARAAKLLQEDIQAFEGTKHPREIEEAGAFFQQLLRRYAKYADGDITFPEEGELPAIDTSTDDAIVRTFFELARYMRRFGPLSLEKAEQEAEHPIMRKGLELMIDGWDPLLVRSILERYRDAYIADVQKKTRMMMDGIASLMDGDVPEVTREKILASLQTS